MSAEALVTSGEPIVRQYVATAAHSAGEVIQCPDGLAGVVLGQQAIAIGDTMAVQVGGKVEVAKTTSMVILDGGSVWWDRSASAATYMQTANTADFYLGTADGDAASADTTMFVNLNARQNCIIEWGEGGWANVVVKTAGTVLPDLAAGLSGKEPGGDVVHFAMSATAEVQKTDALSRQSVPVAFPFMAEIEMAIFDIGDHAALDINVGLANDTHASDADTITESLFVHFDGASLNINLESDDGTTEVAATDTTVDAVDDTFFHVQIDGRDLTDIQVYINGVLMLTASVFKLNNATGPLKGLVHMEKTSNDTPGDLAIRRFSVRTVDVE